MRDAFLGIRQSYFELTGNSKIVVLFLVAMLALVLLDKNIDEDEERRLTNPAVFLLSIWSGIAYTAVVLLKSLKRTVAAVFALLTIAIIALSGQFVVSKEAYKSSIYYGSRTMILVLSAICILIFLLIYYLISVQLFKSRVDRIQFMLCVIVLHLFGFYSEKSIEFSLFLSPLTISSIIIHDIMPILLWIYLIYEDKIKEAFIGDQTETIDTDEIPEEWDMKKHKIINIRNMAIAFAVLTAIFVVSVFVLNRKINSLYEATVALGNAANTKMSVYEMNGADGNVALTLMVSPEGSVTAIGGGEKINGTECYDFIKKHAEKVDKWYLYGNDDSNMGAYNFCIENGIKVTDTFVISGIDKLE